MKQILVAMVNKVLKKLYNAFYDISFQSECKMTVNVYKF